MAITTVRKSINHQNLRPVSRIAIGYLRLCPKGVLYGGLWGAAQGGLRGGGIRSLCWGSLKGVAPGAARGGAQVAA